MRSDRLPGLDALVRRSFEVSRLALLTLTPDEKVACASEGAARLLEALAPDEPWRGRLSEEQRAAWEELLAAARRSGIVKNARLDVLEPDGGVLPLLASVRTLGEPEAVEGYLVTLERWSERWPVGGEATIETLRRLEQLSVVGQLASSFAHEIKSPLHVLLSTAELLLDSQDLTPEVRENLAMMARNAQRAAATARALMDLSAASQIQLAPGSLQQLVERTLGLLEMRLRTKKIELAKRLLPAPPILMDPHHLQAAIYNLLINAVDAMPAGGRLSISVGASLDGREVRLEVADTGIGIEPGLLAKVGDPFFTTKLDGTGMGVFLTKRVAREHRARLEYDSAPGRGTIVTIVFPKT